MKIWSWTAETAGYSGLEHSGVTGGGGATLTFFNGKFLPTYQEKRGREERENREEKKENLKG